MTGEVKTTIESEPDWEYFDFVWNLEKEWRQELRSVLPKTDAGWLQIFPEAKEVIPEIIKEWEEKAGSARVLVKKALLVINSKSAEENRWFWREVIKYTFSPVNELAEAKRHIRRLKMALPSKKKMSRIATWQSELQRAKDVDIVHVAEAFGLRLRKSGSRYFALCPHHNERTASFCIYPPTRYYCFGCSAKGDQISLVQIMAGCSFKEAVSKLQSI